MGDPIHDLQTEIAHRRWQLTGHENCDENWRYAYKVIMHFLDRRPEATDWKMDEDEYSLYKDLVYNCSAQI